MSPTAPDAPPIVVPSAPLQLQYEVNMSPATTTSGRIDIVITSPDVPRVACDVIYIDVPVGPLEGDVFIRAPRIASNSKNWAVSGPGSSDVPLPDKVTGYYRFTVKNQTPGGQGLVPLHPFALVITGTVSTEHLHTNQAHLVISEKAILADNKPFPPDTLCQRKTFPVAKYESFLLYVNSFYATSPGSEDLPKAGFAAGEAIHLSWESNGHLFELYQDGKLMYEGERSSYEVCTIRRNGANKALDKAGKIITKKDGQRREVKDDKGQAVPLSYDEEVFSTELVVLSKGLSAATTFVLKAIGAAKSPLYATLTVTVFNPTYGPELQPIVSSLKSTVNGIGSNKFREGLESRRALEPPVGNRLKNALAETKDENVKGAFSQYNYEFNYSDAWRSPNYGQGAPEQYKTLVNSLNDTQLKKGLLLPINSRFRDYSLGAGKEYVLRILQASSDPNVKDALRETSFPVLTKLLEAANAQAFQAAIQEEKDAALILLFDNENLLSCLGHDEQIALRAAIADAKAKAGLDNTNFIIQDSPDTKYSLRISNGNMLGNIVAQSLSGDNAGVATLSFNGYFDGSHKQFNPAKARYRVGTDQRGDTDRFFIDTYSKGDAAPKPAFTILANGNVGIGTNSPIAPLHVNGSVTAADTTNKIAYFCQGSDFTKATVSVGSPRQLSAYFEGGQFWVNNCIVAGAMNVSSDRRIKHIVSLSDCAADLDLLKKIRVTDYTYIDKLVYTDQVMKKVIAQEIQGLMPSAVNSSTQAVPNVYERATHVSFAAGRVTVTAAKPHELPAIGGKMRLYTLANVDVNADATVVDAHTFSFASDEAYEAGLFVYGKLVDDFLSVDYDAVAMLNVSATQALAQQIDELHQQNAALNEQCQAQGTQVDELRAALHLLQQQVAGLLRQPAGVAQHA